MNRFLTVLFVLVCLHLTWSHFSPNNRIASSDITKEELGRMAAAMKPGDVVMYTTTDCPYCAQARNWLNQYGFAFTECDTQASQECAQRLRELGGAGVPYLIVRGQSMKNGFDSDEFVSLLKN